MSFEALYEVAAENAKVKDWAIADRLIEELEYPFKDSREDRVHIQLKIITFILKMFEEGKKVALLDIPVGAGKSLINVTVAKNTENKSFLCTPQKTLQAQYVREFPTLVEEIKGRNNYYCVRSAGNCSEGLCREAGKYKCDGFTRCEYWQQKARAVNAKICVSNFAYFCLEGGRTFKERELLIIDEGDNIAESAVLGLCTVKLSHWTLWELYDSIDWKQDDAAVLREARVLLANKIDMLEEQDLYTMTDLKRLDSYRDILERSNRIDPEWIVQRGTQMIKGRHGKTKRGIYNSIEFKPLSIAPFAEGLLWRRADKVIISSATILDKQSYINETGLDYFDEEDIVYVSTPSMFPAVNRPIYNYGPKVGKMTAKEISENLPKAIEAIIEIANEHEGQRGIIHTTSFRNVDSLANMLVGTEIGDRMVYHNGSIDRNQLMDMMMRGELAKDAIVVSPSMTRGADLKGALCRFNILLKVPYPNVMDKRTKIRSQDFRWYSLQALREVVQAYGRGVRSATDQCDTYLLDAGFTRLLNGAVKWKVPKWFKEAIIT